MKLSANVDICERQKRATPQLHTNGAVLRSDNDDGVGTKIWKVGGKILRYHKTAHGCQLSSTACLEVVVKPK
jgi:hypothetical protein